LVQRTEFEAFQASFAFSNTLGLIYNTLFFPDISALIVVNASDGSVITSDGRSDVSSQGAAAFDKWEALASAPVDVSIVEMLHENTAEAKKEAAEILLRLVDNVIREPQNIKYRSVRLSNPKIESKLLSASGAFEILFSMGFEEASPTCFDLRTATITSLLRRATTVSSCLCQFRLPLFKHLSRQLRRFTVAIDRVLLLRLLLDLSQKKLFAQIPMNPARHQTNTFCEW